MKQNKSRFFCAFLSIILGVALDQYTKYLAVSNLKGQESISIIDNVFSLYYLENKGAAFGLMQNQQIIFYIGTAIMLLFLVYCFLKLPKTKRYTPLFVIGICVSIGAIGNLIDRIRFGYVVDFLYFNLIDFPVFNVADVFLTVSIIILIVLILFFYKEDDFNWISFTRESKNDSEE